MFKVVCTDCIKDKELFPDGYFNVVKSSLLSGSIPCGCSKTPKWKDWQYLILVRRLGENKNFICHGFVEEFHGNKTKVALECLIDGYKWTATLSKIINSGQGCRKCATLRSKELRALPQAIADYNCSIACKDMNYDFLGFISKYENCYSKLAYKCPKHGVQVVSYRDFITKGSRCLHCYRETSCFYGWYPDRDKDQDFLYILNFDRKFIKVGRSFNLNERISSLKKKSVSGIKNVSKIYIFTGIHGDVYDSEQHILTHLRLGGFSYHSGWSSETFKNESLVEINKIIRTLPLKMVFEETSEQETKDGN